MLEQALAATASERTVTRVQLLSRLCGALYFSDRHERMIRLTEEATQIAVELGDPSAEAMAAAARRRAYWGPGGLERRLADSTQLLQAAREAEDTELALQGHAWLVADLLELGDRTGVETQIEAFAAGAQQLRQPQFLWNALVWRAMLALLDGRLDAATELAQEAVSSGIRSDGVTAQQYYSAQLLAIRREQGRMGELEPAARELVAGNPTRRVWLGGLATLFMETGRMEEASAILAELEGDGFHTLALDNDWMLLSSMFADLASGLGDADRSARLYDQLLPYADVNVVIGIGAVCQGSTSRFLGRLALTMERRAEAVEHLEHAVAASERLGATVWVAHTQVDLARALGAGEQARALIARARATAAGHGLLVIERRAAELERKL